MAARPRAVPTADWRQIELLAPAPGQRTYELIRPVSFLANRRRNAPSTVTWRDSTSSAWPVSSPHLIRNPDDQLVFGRRWARDHLIEPCHSPSRRPSPYPKGSTGIRRRRLRWASTQSARLPVLSALHNDHLIPKTIRQRPHVDTTSPAGKGPTRLPQGTTGHRATRLPGAGIGGVRSEAHRLTTCGHPAAARTGGGRILIPVDCILITQERTRAVGKAVHVTVRGAEVSGADRTACFLLSLSLPLPLRLGVGKSEQPARDNDGAADKTLPQMSTGEGRADGSG